MTVKQLKKIMAASDNNTWKFVSTRKLKASLSYRQRRQIYIISVNIVGHFDTQHESNSKLKYKSKFLFKVYLIIKYETLSFLWK